MANIVLSFLGKIVSPIVWITNSFLVKLFVLVDEPHEKLYANFALIIIFGFVYKIINIIESEKSYSVDRISWFDSFYFSFVVHFTLGFGDIFPTSQTARVFVMIHTTLFWLINLVDEDLVKRITGIASHSFESTPRLSRLSKSRTIPMPKNIAPTRLSV